MNEPEHHKLCRAVGSRVKAIRRKLAISQNDLAELAQLNPSIIGKLERGITNPKLDTLARIAFALNTTVSDITRDVTSDLIEPKANRRITAKDLIEARERAEKEQAERDEA